MKTYNFINDEPEVSFKPHISNTVEDEWKVKFDSKVITENAQYKKFIEPSCVSPCKYTAVKRECRTFTDKELSRILSNIHRVERLEKVARESASLEDYIKTYMENDYRHMEKDLPLQSTQDNSRADQLIKMGVPNIDKQFTYKTLSDLVFSIKSYYDDLNNSNGDILHDEYIEGAFVPIAMYTDYEGNLLSDGRTTDIVFVDDPDDIDKLVLALYRAASCVNIKYHISVIFKNVLSKYTNYTQLHYDSPESRDVKYVRFSLLRDPDAQLRRAMM